MSKPSIASQKTRKENFVAVHKIKEVLTLNKPIYGPMFILDFGKIFLYDVFYNGIENKYVNKAKLLLNDTDNLV